MKFTTQQVIDATTHAMTVPGHVACALVGSVAMFEEGNDLDFSVLVAVEDIKEYLTCHREEGKALHGWAYTDYDTDGPRQWAALRKGHVNLLITNSKEHHEGNITATQVCKALDLRDKRKRIIVHRIVRDGDCAELAEAKASMVPL